MNHQDSFTASKKMCSLAKQFFGYETSKGLIKKIQVHVIEEVEQGPRGLQSLSHGALRLKSFGFGARSLTTDFHLPWVVPRKRKGEAAAGADPVRDAYAESRNLLKRKVVAGRVRVFVRTMTAFSLLLSQVMS